MKPNTKSLPTLEYLNECFRLDNTSPSGLRWNLRPPEHFSSQNECSRWNSRYGNTPAGYCEIAGNTKNFCVKIDSKKWRIHRILYSIYHGKLVPENLDIDHIDGNGVNNTIENLRAVTDSQNLCNSRRKSNNRSGVKGVYWSTTHSRWMASIRYRGVRHYLKPSKCKETIRRHVEAFREKLHGEYTNHG